MKHVPLISFFPKSSNSLLLAKRTLSYVGSMSSYCKLYYLISLVYFFNDVASPCSKSISYLITPHTLLLLAKHCAMGMHACHASELPNKGDVPFVQTCPTYTPSQAMRLVPFSLHLSTWKRHNTHILHSQNAIVHAKFFLHNWTNLPFNGFVQEARNDTSSTEGYII